MLLSVDTSTRQIGLALYDGVSVIGEEIWYTSNHHTVELSPAIELLLERCGYSTSDLSALAVALGPGSFTGLRIGMSVIKGMAFALRIPVIGVATLDIVAAAQMLQELPLAAVLKAGRGRLAVEWYEADFKAGLWKAQRELQVLEVEELSRLIKSPTLVCGELNAGERQILERKRKNVMLGSPAQCIRRPSYLAEIAWNRYLNHKFDDVVTLTPIYLHLSEGSSP